ncbi:wall-associated receptor kinase-like 14 [Dorcoceras hygrometricum]|uniref:Wall-associated receptor kinase-like 14 n=1 Tax=Dorcoceras hygrometricum TaxID=472368 RepID=A0A2Z7BDZ4_9LAMI|nr:wall-associated receptor kinase-like 14 [Dorcoceras hygrometricum]
MVSVQYGPFNSNIPIGSMTIGISRVARHLTGMHTSWRSNSDITCVTRISMHKGERRILDNEALTPTCIGILGITDSVCKNQSVMVSVQYGPFNSNIPIGSMTIGISRVARHLTGMHTSWRSNSDITCVTRISMHKGERRILDNEALTPTCIGTSPNPTT